jgi:cephalosporin hydroxylase
LTLEGDYVVVEDGNLNGHPVLPGWGPGPYEALSAYFEEFPDDYTRDTRRECKFGFTFATSGFLIQRSPGALKPTPPRKASLL